MDDEPQRRDADMTVCGVDLRPLARISSETLRQHGLSAAGAGWANEESQDLRLSVLVDSAQIRAGQSISVNDLGCGYGALYDHLVARGISVTEYNGYDISEEMLSAAEAHVSIDAAHFRRSPNLTRTADYSFLSGPLNLKVSDDETWKAYARTVVRCLARHSRCGFAFNMMTTKVTYRVPDLYYADPAEWLDWCRREVSPHVTLYEDYPLYEFTVGGRVKSAT